MWSLWSEWDECPVRCDGGQQRRTRSCINGHPGEQGCEMGSTTEVRACATEECEYWEFWSTWSACSETCGRGQRTRSRSCVNGMPGDINCQGGTLDVEPCQEGVSCFLCIAKYFFISTENSVHKS